MKYYRHPFTTHYEEYFNRVSRPEPISQMEYIRLQAAGYRVTRAPDHYTIKDVHIKAAIEAGAHPTSYTVEMIKKQYDEKEENEKPCPHNLHT